MISLSKNTLASVSKTHTKEILSVFELKIKVLTLCLNSYVLFSKSHKNDFKTNLKNIQGDNRIKIQSVNWFLKKSTKSTKTKKGVQRNVKSINKTENFFKHGNRIFSNKFEYIDAVKKQLDYFDSNRIGRILSSKPDIILNESVGYTNAFSNQRSKQISKQITRLITFLFDYEQFSKKDSIYTPKWGAYKLTEQLHVSSCLYCNRNYILTVAYLDKNIIRPELDHFFPQSEHPVLSLSFYNLIPSCHICNSNLKGKTSFSLDDYFHPYLGSFDEENVTFTYEPTNPQAFFNNTNGLKVKLDTSLLIRLEQQVNGNIELFKLNEIYHHHQDIIEGLLQLQRKTNKKKITDIYEKILVDSSNNKYSMSEQEIYELTIRNYFNEEEFHKKPMAKFERDIAKELGLILK